VRVRGQGRPEGERVREWPYVMGICDSVIRTDVLFDITYLTCRYGISERMFECFT